MLKKTILLSAASIGTLTVASIASQPAQAQNYYVSGSATLTNITTSTTSVGGEVGGVSANSVIVQPNYTLGSFFGVSSYVNNLTVNAVVNTNLPPLTISQVVAQNLSNIYNLGILPATASNEQNLAAYVSIVRAAGGNDGLE